eukprot:1142656-Pelagomonas_calceolata.AAC.4
MQVDEHQLGGKLRHVYLFPFPQGSNQTNSFGTSAAPLPCGACSHSSPSVVLLACAPVFAAAGGIAAERLRGEGAAAEGKAGAFLSTHTSNRTKRSISTTKHNRAPL